MSEKMDGVRAYWNGERLLSRYGKDLSCPKWFVENLPTNVGLDGELWMGQATTHDNLMKVLNSKTGDWSRIGYYVFDIPSTPGTYEERMEGMAALAPLLPPHVHVVTNVLCSGTEHLQQYLDLIVAAHGEGVIIRKPNTNNEIGFTSSILKVKVSI